jgi:hypothetical protein
MSASRGLEQANERRDAAEKQAEYFASMMEAIRERANLSDDDMARIRPKVRAGLIGKPAGESFPEGQCGSAQARTSEFASPGKRQTKKKAAPERGLKSLVARCP